MIFENLNIALFCLSFFVLTVVFSQYRSSKNIILIMKIFQRIFFRTSLLEIQTVLRLKSLLGILEF